MSARLWRRLPRRIRSIRPWWRRFKQNGYHVDRCEHCGHRFRWSRDARHANGNRDGKVYHGPCLSLVTMRRKAAARLEVIGVMVELTGIKGSDVRGAMSLRANAGRPGSGSEAWNRAWGVFYDLDRAQAEAATP